MLALVDEQGDRASFERLQKQSAWRDRTVDAQLHRFLRVKARRMHRDAGRLVETAVECDRAPRPLLGAPGLL